jgi:hypothetical protein
MATGPISTPSTDLLNDSLNGGVSNKMTRLVVQQSGDAMMFPACDSDNHHNGNGTNINTIYGFIERFSHRWRFKQNDKISGATIS